MTRIIKVSGNDLGDDSYLSELARQIAQLAAQEGRPPILVHGGGKDIAALQTRLSLPVRQVDGLRVTDAESLMVAEMVLSGHANKRIVRALLAVGLPAIGLSGVDGGLLRCHKKAHPTADLGLVGEIVAVNTDLLGTLLATGLMLVISPISLGTDGRTYNVNADEAAGAIARALGASSLDFVSNVRGIMKDSVVVPALTSDETGELVAAGVITGGMLPKVSTALSAVAQGVPAVRIVDLPGLAAEGGTVFRCS